MKNKFNEDKVSIIIPVYNAEKFLEETVTSALNQTYENLEVILINDFSKDKSEYIMKKLAEKDGRIVNIFLKENKGVSNARNEGIRVANGRYIAFLDSDDLWENKKLEKQIDFMKKNSIKFSYTGYEFINENSEFIGKKITVPERINYNQLLKYNCIGCLTVVIDRLNIKNINFEKIKHEDYLTWLSILKNNNIEAYGINESLAYYRKRSGSISENKFKSASWHWNIIRKIEKVSLTKSVFYFLNYAFINIKKHIL